MTALPRRPIDWQRKAALQLARQLRDELADTISSALIDGDTTWVEGKVKEIKTVLAVTPPRLYEGFLQVVRGEKSRF